MPERAADYTMAVSIPFHSHVAMNCIVSDYVPKAALGASSPPLYLISFHKL
jgi:hypothetical protein